MNYVTGKVIRELRERRKMTQKELADILQISDKTVSKWETDKGLPDIGMLDTLAAALRVSIAELLVGEYVINKNPSCNMKKTNFYICPICGNVVQAIGEGAYSCCGVMLPVAEIEENNNHDIKVDIIENEYFISLNHSMTKEHYISFFAYVTADKTSMVKLYPEQEAQCRFTRCGHGFIYCYCNNHGLFRITV